MYEMIDFGEFDEGLQDLFKKLYDNVDFSKEENMNNYMMCFLSVIDDIILRHMIGAVEEGKNRYIYAYKDLELECLDGKYLKEHIIEKYTIMLNEFSQPLPSPLNDSQKELKNYERMMAFKDLESSEIKKALDILR